jgi:hypothetical protein
VPDQFVVAWQRRFGNAFGGWGVDGLGWTRIARRGLTLISGERPRFPQSDALLEFFADFVLSTIVATQLAQW